MQTYSYNMLDSNAYFNNKRRELETLIDQEDHWAICYTLSAADSHWLNVYRLLYDRKLLPHISDPIKNVG